MQSKARTKGWIAPLVLAACAGGSGGPVDETGPLAVDAPSSDGAAGSDAATGAVQGPPGSDSLDTIHRQCTAFDPNRTLLFGDMHVHTSYSFDANGYGTRLDPAGAYAFAKGHKETVGGTLTAKLARPLDFTAVTDHSEHFGQYPKGMFTGADPAKQAWEHEQMAANQANDATPACTFAALIAYEWTGETGGNWFHRNVIFRNEHVPGAAISFKDAPVPEQLWTGLTNACLTSGTGCDVISIPHNSNYSAGNMFSIPENMTAAEARTRQSFEPLVEIYQHKGGSECHVGVGTMDPLCGFYDNHPADCVASPSLPACQPGNFVRNALRRGLQVAEKVGTNPLKLGFIADTDTHSATPGETDEWAYQGQKGPAEATPSSRLVGKDALNNAGGLSAVWAEERSRDAVFRALRRRETYGTSGTRITVRFFGGFGLPGNLCGRSDLVSVGYASGVPMGGSLVGGTRAPTFVVSALKDPGVLDHPGTKLQRVQIIKGWVDAKTGDSAEKIYEIAGDPQNGASVDTKTCETSGPGNDALCAVWTDPDFVPDDRAFYYARIVENPTCSVQQRDCNTFAPGTEPTSCTDGSLPKTVHHRAWTSPIWYRP